MSWHFTVVDISKTWVTEDLDSVVNDCIRKWVDILMSGIRSNVFLERNKFGLNICPLYVKLAQCPTVLRNSLKDSQTDSLNLGSLEIVKLSH